MRLAAVADLQSNNGVNAINWRASIFIITSGGYGLGSRIWVRGAFTVPSLWFTSTGFYPGRIVCVCCWLVYLLICFLDKDHATKTVTTIGCFDLEGLRQKELIGGWNTNGNGWLMCEGEIGTKYILCKQMTSKPEMGSRKKGGGVVKEVDSLW